MATRLKALTKDQKAKVAHWKSHAKPADCAVCETGFGHYARAVAARKDKVRAS